MPCLEQLEKQQEYQQARNTEFIFDSNNVAVCQIVKPNNFLMFQFQYYCNESELPMNSDNSFDDKRLLARQMEEEENFNPKGEEENHSPEEEEKEEEWTRISMIKFWSKG